MTGRIHSFQSLGTLDGPGVRFVAFFQGCPLRCGCCHNPDTWDPNGGTEYSAPEILQKALRCRAYFGKEGGVTLSGGEPLMQKEFAAEIFRLCKEENIHTCLDTSGCFAPESCAALLQNTDRVLLDIKYTQDALYRLHAGCEMENPLRFLSYLNAQSIPVTLRQVIIPTLNDTEENILALLCIAKTHPCVDKIELLPFKKICQTKYDSMGIPFPFAHLPTPDKEKMDALRALLGSYGG
ncbi:MAG: pyruvate formate lyase-activating protein [Clostridiales bacterium]|nr:pyruvate formate lyase-activating protein [Clostridiales bacterium]